tara:strand:+ start:372 stop:791 length:420 start_codon:yes stop_codon:yes gene_type:complete
MKKLKTTICALVAAATLGLGGCSGNNEATTKVATHPPFEYLSGKPINAEAAVVYHTAELSSMVQTEDGKYVLCFAKENRMSNPRFDWYHGNILEAKTIIQSEIDDGDNEKITMKGWYEGDKFGFVSVSANDYTAEAKRY